MNNEQLVNLIKCEINKVGSISFADYMAMCLTTPEVGYYNQENIIGSKGDFITAPTLGSIFAECLVNFIDNLKNGFEIQEFNILEIGAGTGQLCFDILNSLETQNITISSYNILEKSDSLKIQQQNLINNKFKTTINWLDDLPKNFNGIVIANEILDVLPVNCFCFKDNEFYEKRVVYQNDTFDWILEKSNNNSLICAFENLNLPSYLGATAHGYQSEICLEYNNFITSIANSINQGGILFIDYGFKQSEYYHPMRQTGTIMCHYKHETHPNPFINIGNQDITAHVDFSLVKNIADNLNMDTLGFANLASFLINCDLLNIFESKKQTADSNQANKLSQEINILTSPAEMGELFKVMFLGKKIHTEVAGFQNYDKTHTL